MKIKFLYIILISIAVTTVTVGITYATTSFTSTMVNPSSNLASAGAQYLVQFYVPSSVSNVVYLKVVLPTGATMGSLAQVVMIQGMTNYGTSYPNNPNSTTITYKVNPQTIFSGTTVSFFVSKIQNPASSTTQTVSFTMLDSLNATLATGSGTFALKNNLGGITWDTTDNNISLGGNITSSTANEFKITTSSNVPICIGSC